MKTELKLLSHDCTKVNRFELYNLIPALLELLELEALEMISWKLIFQQIKYIISIYQNSE